MHTTITSISTNSETIKDTNKTQKRGGQYFCISTRIIHKFYNLQHKCDKNLHLQTIFKSTIYNLQGNIGFEGKETLMTNALYAGP